MFKKLYYQVKQKLNASKKLNAAYDQFWHKVDGRRQFAYRNCERDLVTILLYQKVAKSTSLVKYVKIKSDVSVHNRDLAYWSRRAMTPELRTRTRAKLLEKQGYKCALCLGTFLPGGLIETDYIQFIAKGGKYKFANLELLHAVCHDYKDV